MDVMNAERYPAWIFLIAILIGASYFPTVTTPFDFIDDGNLVYPAASGTTWLGHINLWWEKVRANYEHLGPFRPVLWAHWELFANLCGGEALPWRIIRLGFCILSAGMLLWFFREMKLHPVAAVVTTIAAMANPYRGEIWTSLTLAEGVAMPYALLALVGARKAARANRPWCWELLAFIGVIAALGCKNTYAALFPAMFFLRLFPENQPLHEGWRRNRWRASLLLVPIVLPIAHFVYFKQNWHPGQYETAGVSWSQFVRILNALKGGLGLDFLGVSLVVVLVVLWRFRGEMGNRQWLRDVGVAGILTASGILVYLPMNMMSGRYTMPGIWGLDLLVGLLLTQLFLLPKSVWKTVAGFAMFIGLVVLLIANNIRQEKFAARARLLWAAVRYVEQRAEPNAKIAWYSGDSTAGELNIEEGIHFRWHLLNRGRADIAIGLFDLAGNRLDRVELPQFEGEPNWKIGGKSMGAEPRVVESRFQENYQFGRKFFECQIGR
jgi:hypothetical protein